MFFNLINLLIGFSLVIIAFAILLNYFKVNKINFFFFLLILFAGIARFQYGLVSLGFIKESKPLIFRVFIALFIFPPIYFLCLKSFISSKSSWTRTLTHFIFFLLIIAVRLYFGEIDLRIIGVLFFVYSAFYYYLLTRSSLTYLRNNQSIYSKQQLLKVKQLIIWIFALSLNNFIFSTYFIFFSDSNKHDAIQGMFDNTIIVWILFVSYLFFNHSLLYNEVFKKKDPNRDFLNEFSVWNSKPLQKIDPRDTAIEVIIRKNLEKLIQDLRTLKPALIIQSNSTNLIHEIANHLNYPKSHLKFAMKYHCRFSQSDYLNLMRVIHALTLLNNGYLDNFTIETLGEKCHFNSRTSFYRHFKKHMGVSPSKYKTLID
jgi:AraC-like DNA-binding protein